MVSYKCSECGNVYEMEFATGTQGPSCCGKPCTEMVTQTANPDENKHVPYFERTDGGVLVKVGKAEPHPMTDDHFIVYIEISADGTVMRKYLKPGDKPEAFFETDASVIVARELCNKHGLYSFE